MPRSLGYAQTGNVLSRNLSVFLDLLRVAAALLVLVGHMGAVYQLGLPDILAHSAKEGVAIFFMLSGFVIAFVTTCKEKDWRSFARARILRMGSVVPLAIVALLLCHAAGSVANPALYDVSHAGDSTLGGALVGVSPDWFSVLRYLTFTNEIWFDRAVISTGAPFWSLGFEAAYYVAFAILVYMRGARRWIFATLWLMVCGPRIVVAFPLWLLGVAAWHLVQLRPRVRPLVGTATMAVLALSALAWRRWAGVFAVPLFEWPGPAILTASMVYYLELGVLVAAMVVVFAACTPDHSIWPPRVERTIRYCAGASFTLYIAHLPVMVLLAATWPASIGSLWRGLLAAGMSVAATFMLAEVGERRKVAYARGVIFLSESLSPSKTKNIPAID